AQERLKEKGWNNLRPALSVTVRVAIMRAAMDGNLRQEPQASVHYLRRALDLLEWGRSIWENVPKDNRGEIFEDTFVIGVRGMYLKMFSEAYHTDPGLNSKFPLEHLKKEAEDLLKETELAPTLMKEKVDPGFLLSFIQYPAGIAHSYVFCFSTPDFWSAHLALLCRMIGLYHVEMAQYCAKAVFERSLTEPTFRCMSLKKTHTHSNIRASGRLTLANRRVPTCIEEEITASLVVQSQASQ
ncbi:hypothetical protein K503DRAFT_701512, partial [Rhizopogon vinicolor AM-OR11-026]